MQTLDLYDTICLKEIKDETVQISCNIPELDNKENLATRAAQLVLQRMSLRRGFLIELYKRIPLAAGLGGGSSDAAAVLLALQRWQHFPFTASDLLEMAATLGSDVPFFLIGGLALCEGRGERVTRLASYWPAEMRWLLLVKPALAVSTAEVFAHLSASDYSDGAHSRAICSALAEQRALPTEHLYNGLERGVLQRYPQVKRASDDLQQAGARLVRLSGSGPTLFAPFSELAQALEIQSKMRDKGYEVYLSRTVYPTTDIC